MVAGRGSTLVRRALLVLTPLVTGWLGFALSFSDRSPGESVLERAAVILGAQMLGGAVVGFLWPRRWYVSAAAAWGSLFWAVLLSWGALRSRATVETPGVAFPEDQIHPEWVPFVAVALTIALGYGASRARNARSAPGSGAPDPGSTRRPG